MVGTIYQDSIELLTSQGKFYINLGLERVQKILDIMGNPQNSLKFIHVAGTNGKGSVCSMLSSILKENNKKVGLFTSPHIFEYTERIKFNDTEIDEEIFANWIHKITQLADKNNIHLTEFEVLTVIAFQYFAENNVEVVILETGLGGRLDATNIINRNICSIITHIDLDHTERLGETIEKIAFEKAGIIKENCPVIIDKNNMGLEVIKNAAKNKNAEHIIAGNISDNFVSILSLKGNYQKENLKLVIAAIEILNKNGFNIEPKSIEMGLKNVKHPCRFEYIKEKNLLIDGAHNPDGTKALRESLNQNFPNQKFNFIFGCLRNKEYSLMMKNLFTPKDDIYFYEFNSENSCKYSELSSVCGYQAKPFSEFVYDQNTLTVICGSFYMIKELLTKIDIK